MTRRRAVALTCGAALAAGALLVLHPTPRLIWNATASTPVGLYVLRPAERLRVGELVAIRPPGPVARFLAGGGFLPEGVLLLKHVTALHGQTVCRAGDVVTVDHTEVGEAHDRDHLGRPLPRWRGCRTLRAGDVFLMNPAVPGSLDGRYFGPFPVTSIIARAVPLWTGADGGGRLVRRAAAD